MGHSSGWAALLADHASAVEEYVTAAERLSPQSWMQPLSAGKWSPAEVTSHVAEAYRVLRGELGGADGMRMLGSRLQRFVLRHTVLPRLLAGSGFPPGVRAPRETRPREIEADTALALSTLSALAEGFARELTARAAGAKISLTHAYFGPLTAEQGLKLLTVHIRHHARQLLSPTL
jgi:hypothetical protein